MLTNRQVPNIVFIVLDTQRSDRLGCYGYDRGTTPNLDAFAQKATLFENAISPAQWTVPSHASIFTGEPPSTHLTLQSSDALPPVFATLAERLGTLGYRRTGICNNPLVGLINNNLKRGFPDFYNYCGTVQSRAPTPLRRFWRLDLFGVMRHALRQLVAPIQDAFGRQSQVFQAALNPFWVPLWSRFARFKGDTPRSIRDATRFVRQRIGEGKQPHFLFINVMEPHLPYSPPDRFVESFCPYLNTDREAYEFMHSFNRQAVEWLTPASSPFSELQARTMSDMYDAEVAYQDHLLAGLLSELDRPEHKDNTMVILAGDHGEMLGEKQYVGHAFGVYRELIHVPLIVRWPGQAEGQRLASTVSATRLFHTVLEAAGAAQVEMASGQTIAPRDQSLRAEMDTETDAARTGSRATESRPVISEAYAPEFALQTLETHKPGLIDKMACSVTHWAVYDETHKLIHIQNTRDELYSLADDPRETHALDLQDSDHALQHMRAQLSAFLDRAHERRPTGHAREQVDLEDTMVQERLRGLGYIE
jgi:arylsulfatase A-like enzyme